MDIELPLKFLLNTDDLLVPALYAQFILIPGNESKTMEDFLNEAFRGPAGADGATGPAGADGEDGAGSGGKIRDIVQESLAPGQTTNSTTFVDTGLDMAYTPLEDSKIRVQVKGYAAHTASGNILHFTLLRKIGAGSFVDLKASGASGLSTVRTISADYVEEFNIDFMDSPETDEEVTYKLAWRVHNNTGHLGKRPADTTMNVATVMTLTEITA